MNRTPNPVVELVKAWEIFEQEHPDGNLVEFCQDYLTRQGFKEIPKGMIQFQEDVPPMRAADALSATIARMTKYQHFYSRKAMQRLPVDNFEDWVYLATLHFNGSMRKSELIHQNISEFTSGTNVINRLLKHALVAEFDDPDDARSKRVKITEKGVDWVQQSLPDMINVSDLLWQKVLTDEEMELAFHILLKADRFHSRHYTEFRNQPLEEIRKRLE
jgi:DNA-binding MarR family transcriptional regulator